MAFLRINIKCGPCLLTLGFREGLLNVGQTDNMGLWPKPSMRFLMDLSLLVRYISFAPFTQVAEAIEETSPLGIGGVGLSTCRPMQTVP